MTYEAPNIEIIVINAHEDVVCDLSSRQIADGNHSEFATWFDVDEFK